MADGHDPGRPDDAARALRPDLHRRDRRRPSARWRIHRAIYGSLERFIGILIEHFAGAFPVWCAPVQAVVIPIADRHIEPARRARRACSAARGLRVEVDSSDNRMQNKIRLAQEQKVPYMLVLGDREVEARTVAATRNAARGEQQNGGRAGTPSPIGWPRPNRTADRLGGSGQDADRAQAGPKSRAGSSH